VPTTATIDTKDRQANDCLKIQRKIIVYISSFAGRLLLLTVRFSHIMLALTSLYAHIDWVKL